jgi:hypothetical protein
MNFNKLILPILTVLAVVSQCDKKIPITEFEDDFKEYKTEPRIEGILNTTDLEESVVRIDKTILVTNTDLYDGEDNDGDWEKYEDLNGNGKWDKNEPLNDDIGVDPDGEEGVRDAKEGKGNGQPDDGEPHIDELDEILPQIHDSTYNVFLYESESGKKVMDFKWSSRADAFLYEENPETEGKETVFYGGYVPDKIYVDKIDYSKNYEFEFSKNDTTITGQVAPVPPAEFQTPSFATEKEDTLVIERGYGNKISWTTTRDATVFWVIVRQVFSPDSMKIMESMPMTPVAENEDEKYIGKDFIDLHAPGLYQWEVVVPSRQYGHYFYSSLPIRDKELNNLRDQNNEVVLGIAGSVASATQYVRIVNGE